MLDKQSLSAAYTKKLAESALTTADAKKLGFSVYTAEEVAAKKLNGEYSAAGFVIPYFTQQHKRTDFYRFRYLEQPQRKGFAALAEHKPMRYSQPASLHPQTYFPPIYPWDSYFKTPADERRLLITEGELKAACACKMGLPTVALGGVWNFRSAKAGTALLDDLAALPLKGSTIYIVYDSDAVNNPEVLKAENALARELLKLKARVLVVRLPELKKGKKCGLDDFLVARSTDKLTELLDEAEEWETSKALHAMNEEVLFLLEQGAVLDLEKRIRWRAYEFVNAIAANRKHTVTEGSGDKVKLVEKSTAREWVQWEGRAQVDGVTYRPGDAVIVDSYYNAWHGWGIKDEHIKRGNIAPWPALLDFLFIGHKLEHRKWFEQWLAYPLQHPGTKMFTTAVFWGLPGTGKTLIGHTMSRIYGANYTEVNERELHSAFNEWAEFKQFALGDEITGGDKRAVADYLKGLITQKFLRINPKHIRPYTVPDCMNWLFTSNHCDAFFLEDDDRRYFVVEVKNPKREREFYRIYDEWFKSDAGIGALFYYLLHLDLAGFDPMDEAPATASKLEMIGDGRSDLATWCAALRENPDEVLRQGQVVLNRRLFTTTELHAMYDPGKTSRVTVNGMARELKRAGFRKALDGAPIYTRSNGVQRLWTVRSREELSKWRKPEQFGKAYDDDLGPVLTASQEKFK